MPVHRAFSHTAAVVAFLRVLLRKIRGKSVEPRYPTTPRCSVRCLNTLRGKVIFYESFVGHLLRNLRQMAQLCAWKMNKSYAYHDRY